MSNKNNRRHRRGKRPEGQVLSSVVTAKPGPPRSLPVAVINNQKPKEVRVVNDVGAQPGSNRPRDTKPNRDRSNGKTETKGSLVDVGSRGRAPRREKVPSWLIDEEIESVSSNTDSSYWRYLYGGRLKARSNGRLWGMERGVFDPKSLEDGLVPVSVDVLFMYEGLDSFDLKL